MMISSRVLFVPVPSVTGSTCWLNVEHIVKFNGTAEGIHIALRNGDELHARLSIAEFIKLLRYEVR